MPIPLPTIHYKKPDTVAAYRYTSTLYEYFVFPYPSSPSPLLSLLPAAKLNWVSDVGTERGKKGVYFVVSVLSHNQLFGTIWTLAHQPPLSMELSKQEYETGLPFPPPGYLPNSGIKPGSPVSPALQVGSLPAEPFYQHYASYFKYIM